MIWLLVLYLVFVLGFILISWFIIQTRILKFRYPGDLTNKVVSIFIILCLLTLVISFYFILKCDWSKFDFARLANFWR